MQDRSIVTISAVRFWIFINRFGFGLKPRFRFRFQNRHSTTFNKKYNQPLTCHTKQINLSPFSKAQHDATGGQLRPISVNQQTRRARRIERCCAF